MMLRGILAAFPEKGWGVVRCTAPVMAYLVLDGYCKAQYTPYRGVYQARLTGKGRAARNGVADA